MGQTKKKVEEALKKAMGAVLFIDEAYTLGRSQYGQEAVDSLVTIYNKNDRYKKIIYLPFCSKFEIELKIIYWNFKLNNFLK